MVNKIIIKLNYASPLSAGVRFAFLCKHHRACQYKEEEFKPKIDLEPKPHRNPCNKINSSTPPPHTHTLLVKKKPENVLNSCMFRYCQVMNKHLNILIATNTVTCCCNEEYCKQCQK